MTVGSNSKGVFSASLLRTPLKLGVGSWRLDTKEASSALASVCESEKPGGGDGNVSIELSSNRVDTLEPEVVESLTVEQEIPFSTVRSPTVVSS